MNATELKVILSHLIFESSEDGRQLAVPYVIGEKGDGKSTIIRDICESQNARVIDIRLALEDVPDLKGFPHIVDGKTAFATPDWIPFGNTLTEMIQEGTKRTSGPFQGKPYAFVVVFFDEMARAKLDVHQVIFKMVLDFSHQAMVFDEKVRFVSADNPATKDYKGVNKLDAALLDRFCALNYDGPTLPEWQEYERAHCDPMIIRFLGEQSALYRKGKATPRTLSKIGRRILKSTAKNNKNALFNIIDGMCGAEFAAAFIRYYESSYQAIKAKELFENGERDFERHIRTIRDWNSADGKMSDALSDTASDILDYFRDATNAVNFTVARMVKILNSFPDDKTWMIVRTIADDKAAGYPAAWKNIQQMMIKSPDIRQIIQSINKQMGDGK